MALGKAIGVVGSGAVVAHAGPALMPLFPPLANLLGVPRILPEGEARPQLAITFDDGPHPEGTPQVLDLLADEGMVATFFVVGERVRATPALAREIVEAGHKVALHCDLHRNALRLTRGQIREDISRARATIQDTTGIDPQLQRAPLGIYTPSFLKEVQSAGLQPWIWSQWGRDWRARATPESIIHDATSKLKAGDVVLLHDGDDYSAEGSHRRTVAALPGILNAVKERSLEPILLP